MKNKKELKKSNSPVKRERGRPPKYDPKFIDELIEYFSIPPYTTETKTIMTKKGPIEVEERVASDMPTKAGFAIKIGVSRETLHDWCKQHPDFSDAFRMAELYQENYFAVNGPKGLIQPTFSKFLAVNITSWRDKQEVVSTNIEVKEPFEMTDDDNNKILNTIDKILKREK